MRKVVDARQVCHLWANKSQDEARTPSGNIYFTGATLYSYGSHFVIAHHLEGGAILWNSASYSVTTNKQQSFAGQALASWQWDKRLYTPHLKCDDVRNLERVRRDGEGKQLPTLAEALASAIVSKVQSIASMREGKGPEASAFHDIKQWERTGLALCAYVAKGKRAPKWPLSALPEVMPTGEARKVWIQSIAKSRLLTTHADQLSAASRSLAELAQLAQLAIDAADTGAFPDWWRLNNVQGSLAVAGRNIAAAASAYQAATGKKSAKVRNAWKQHSEVEAKILPIAHVYEMKRARAAIKDISRDAYALMRTLQANRNNVWHRTGRQLGFFVSRLSDAIRCLPPEEAAQHAAMLARFERVDNWLCADNALKSANETFEGAMSYLPEHAGDAVRMFKQAAMHADDATRRHPAFAALHAEELAQVSGPDIERLIAEAKAQQARLHAQKIEAWKAGEALVTIPYSAGTFARIRGNVVQTSRGASVPLSHACRLAKIARRVIAHGGKVWEHGQGPRVGGFMVRSIGADGSAVIGCHEFDGAESLRMLALLEACAECQNITDDTHEA